MSDNPPYGKPSIADLSPAGVLPSERARATATDTRALMLRMFAEKIGFTVERQLNKVDGSIEFTLRPTL